MTESGSYEPAPQGPTEVRIQWGVRIPLHDGAFLSATVYLPQSQDAPSAVILAMTPYTKDSHHERCAYFAAHGYPCVIADVRGRGDSEGIFHPLNDTRDAYSNDGYDVVEWLAKQPYCNGKVAMWGGSYLAYCQWAAARRSPPHLVSIVPVASPFRGIDSPARNNIFAPYVLQWLTLVSGRTSQRRMFADRSFWAQRFKQWFQAGVAFSELDTFLGNPSPIFQEWISHPHGDAYWDSYNPTADDYSKISIPILTITGAYDGDQLGALAHYRQHMKHACAAARANHYLIIGPWDHAGTGIPQAEFCGLKVGPESLVDLAKLHLQWYAWTMRDAAKPEFLRKNVAYYVTGAEQWRYADTLEAITSRAEPLYLRSARNPTDVFQAGSLTPDVPIGGEPDHYVYDPRDVGHADLESTLDPDNVVEQRMIHAATGKQLVYHSAAFVRDTEVSGFFKLTAWLSIDQPDTDFRASIYEVGIDGVVLQLTADWLRARYRESFREPRRIDTRAPLRYDFERFMFVSRRIRKGHRLMLIVGPINSIHWEKNYNSGGVVSRESMADARTVTVRLFHDEVHRSVLYVPIGAESS